MPQAVVTFGGPGIGRARPRLLRRLYRQPHPGRRLVLLAALSRGAREARPGLRRLHQPGLAHPLGDTAGRHRHPRRRHRRDHRRDRAASSAAWPRKGRPRTSSLKTKTYLKGSFPLGLDTSGKIAAQLVQMQLDNLGIDYIERRPALIDAVTLADAKRVAKRLLDAGPAGDGRGPPERRDLERGRLSRRSPPPNTVIEFRPHLWSWVPARAVDERTGSRWP